MRTVRTEENQLVKKVLKKYPKVVIRKKDALDGVVYIKNIRWYRHLGVEVDIEYHGKIFAKLGLQRQWFDSSIMTEKKHSGVYRVSKIKLNRFIRKSVFNDLKSYLGLFDIDLRFYNYIKKIKWVEASN